MTIDEALTTAGIERLDAELLLAHIVGKDRSWLITHQGEELSPEQEKSLGENLSRKKKGEPTAYILGTQEFYGRSFIVTPDVLIPRPATESLIDCVEQTLASQRSVVIDADTQIICGSLVWKDLSNVRTFIDIGTGSGCIAITLAYLHPDFHVIATDISAKALDVAKVNAKNLDTEIEFREGNLMEPVKDFEEPFFLVSNPPYIPEGTVLMPSVHNFEPHSALFAGIDGTDAIRELIDVCRTHPYCAGVAVECRAEQWASLS